MKPKEPINKYGICDCPEKCQLHSKKPIKEEEFLCSVTFALYRKRPKPLKDELVGYESWDSRFGWGYSPPDVLGARGWNGHYIYHDYKIKVENL